MIGWSDKPGRSVSRFKGSSHGCFLYSILFSIALYLNVNSSGWLIFNVLLCLFFLWSIVLGTTWWTIMINAKYSDRMIAHVHGDYEIWKDANDTGYGDWIGSFMVTLVCTPFSSCFFCFASSSRPRTTMARNFGCAAGSAVYAICLWIAMVLLDYFVGDYQFSSSSYQYYINYGQLWQLSMGVPAVIFTVWAIMHIAIGFSLMVSIARARTIAAAAALGAPQEYPPPTGRKRGYLVGMMLELFWTPVFAIPFALAFGKSDPKFSSSAMYGAAFMTMLEAFGVCGILGWQIASRKNGGFSGFSDSHQIQNSSYNYFGFFIEPVVLVLILLSVAMIVCFSFFWVLAWIYGKQIKYSQRLISMASSSSKMMIKQQQPQVQYMQQMIQPVVITSPPVQLQQQLATPSTMDFVSTPIITNQSSTAPLLQPMLSNSNNNNNNNYSPQSIATFDKQPLPLNDYTQQNQIRPTGTFRPVQHQQSSNMGVDAATDYHVGGSGSGGSTSGKGKANGVSIGDGNDALPPAYVPGENGASFAARGEKKDMFLHPASSFNAGGESSSSSNGGGSASQQPSAPHDEEEEEEVYYHPPEAGSLSYSSNHAQQHVEEASAPFLTIDRSYTPAPPPPGPHPFQVRSFSQVSVPSPPFEPSASFSSSSLPPVPPPPPAPFTPPPPPALPFSDISSPFTDVESPFTDVLTPAPPPPPQQNQYSVRVDNATEFWNINFGAGTVVTGEDLKMALEIRRIGSSAALPWNDNDYVDLDNFLIIVNDVKNPIFYLFY